MSPEIIIALGALVLGAVAIVSVQGLTKRSQATALALQREQALLTEKMTQRIRQLEARIDGEGTAESDAHTRRKLAATVHVLELRALEHDSLLCSLVTEDEARHLWNVSKDLATTYELHPGVEAELRSLVRRGLLKKRGDFKIHELASKFDLNDRFAITESGEMLLTLRKHLKAADTRTADSLPPAAPESGVLRSAPPPFARPMKTA